MITKDIGTVTGPKSFVIMGEAAWPALAGEITKPWCDPAGAG
jgi:hypothetical protein